MANFGTILRILRAEKKMSQQELADALKISKSAINMYERGERQPNFEVMELIADYFNVDMDYLYGRTEIRKKYHFDSHGTEYVVASPTPSMVREEPTYYGNKETAKLAQEMFEDEDMRSLFDMKRNMPPERFKAHMEFMKNLYKQETGNDV